MSYSPLHNRSRWLRVDALPPKEKSLCAFEAAKHCLDFLSSFERRTLGDSISQDFCEAYLAWTNGELGAAVLHNMYLELRGRFCMREGREVDLTKDTAMDILLRYGGFALGGVYILACLDWSDVSDSILSDTVVYSAAVACEVREPRWLRSMKDLTDQERQFIEEWWLSCCRAYPQLRTE